MRSTRRAPGKRTMETNSQRKEQVPDQDPNEVIEADEETLPCAEED